MLIIRLCLFLTADSQPTSRDDYDLSGDYSDYSDSSSELDLGSLGKNIIYQNCNGSEADCQAISNLFADAFNLSEYSYDYYYQY